MSAKSVIFALIALVVISLSAFFGWKFGHKKGYSEGYSALHPSDTVVVIDTHFVDRPVEVVKWYEKDKPVYIAVHDTTTINDTTFVVMPREVRQYRDSTYFAQVSGVDPSLDWIKVYQKTVTVTNYVEKKVPYKEKIYLFGDGSFSPLLRGVRVGAMYERQLIGPLTGGLGCGYEWNNYGKDWFLTARVTLDIRTTF